MEKLGNIVVGLGVVLVWVKKCRTFPQWKNRDIPNKKMSDFSTMEKQGYSTSKKLY
jgi:hypothetical protein